MLTCIDNRVYVDANSYCSTIVQSSTDIDICLDVVEGPSLSSKYDLHITYSLPLTAHIIHPKLGKHNNILHPNFVLSGNP